MEMTSMTLTMFLKMAESGRGGEEPAEGRGSYQGCSRIETGDLSFCFFGEIFKSSKFIRL